MSEIIFKEKSNLLLYEVITRRDRNKIIMELRQVHNKEALAKITNMNISEYINNELYEYRNIDLDVEGNNFIISGEV